MTIAMKRVRFLLGLISLVLVGAGSIQLMQRLETQELTLAAFNAFWVLFNGFLVWVNWHD